MIILLTKCIEVIYFSRGRSLTFLWGEEDLLQFPTSIFLTSKPLTDNVLFLQVWLK